MDTKIDSDVESEWVKIVKSTRSAELESGAVKSISWEEIEKILIKRLCLNGEGVTGRRLKGK